MDRRLFCLLIFCYNVLGYPNGDGITQYTLIDRESWEAAPSSNSKLISHPVPYVVIHHTYIPPACNTTEHCSASMRSMQRYHMSKGWGDIGYNFCIGGDGYVYEGRGWEVIGIHAGPANRLSIGICLIGDWRTEPPPDQMLDATKALISSGVEAGYLNPSFKLIGHNQTTPTECPGTELYKIISTWKHFTDHPEFVIKKPK